jgi:hypothetical protein
MKKIIILTLMTLSLSGFAKGLEKARSRIIESIKSELSRVELTLENEILDKEAPLHFICRDLGVVKGLTSATPLLLGLY